MLITNKNVRKELEQRTLKEILSRKDMFSINEIILLMRSVCNDNIEVKEIEEVVFDAFEVCLVEGKIKTISKFNATKDMKKPVLFLVENEKVAEEIYNLDV